MGARRFLIAAAIAALCAEPASADLPGGTVVIAEISPDASHVATIDLLPEITSAPVGSPPGSPGIAGFQPYLFLAGADGANRDVVARAMADTGWSGTRLTRSDNGDDPPFPLTVCLLAGNTDFPCERDVARDPAHDVFGPAFAPDGTLVAVVRAGAHGRSGRPSVMVARRQADRLRARRPALRGERDGPAAGEADRARRATGVGERAGLPGAPAPAGCAAAR